MISSVCVCLTLHAAVPTSWSRQCGSLGSRCTAPMSRRTAATRRPIAALGEKPPRAQVDLVIDEVRHRISEAARLRRMIDEVQAASLRVEGVEPESVAELEFKSSLRKRSDEVLSEAKLLFDLRSACIF